MMPRIPVRVGWQMVSTEIPPVLVAGLAQATSEFSAPSRASILREALAEWLAARGYITHKCEE